MAVFVDLDEEGEPPNPQPHSYYHHTPAVNSEFSEDHSRQHQQLLATGSSAGIRGITQRVEESEGRHVPNPNRNAMTEAFGCYPIAIAVVSCLDLNALDNLARSCRQIREALLQYRSSLVGHTLHCVNEEVVLDPEDTMRYRARASNLFYMQEVGRGSYNGKSGQCARDMVSECRRCATVICRNCAIKPPAPIVLRDRHRRLCISCSKAPLGTLVKPPLLESTSVEDDMLKRAICTCQSDGVWLCQPCGRSIRSADHDYQSIWKWRSQYGEVLGGVGTGIGGGDRGMVCGRDTACCAAKEREQETDCDAEDAREFPNGTPVPGPWVSSSTTSPSPFPAFSLISSRTPSPSLGPGYARQEIEGIGGVVKTKKLSMIRVGACVPEWEDEKMKGHILGREVSGRARSWCGWCWRVIPGQNDYERQKLVIRSCLPERAIEATTMP